MVMQWQRKGQYEHEVATENGHQHYTGWVRCVNGRSANGRWPQWRGKETRY